MLLVSYETPVIAADINKPPAMANKSFPYNSLANDRRFEELVYSLFKAKISDRTIAEYDSISLMSGVRDKGRDCALIKNGKSVGVIQCKMYRANLNKQVFGEEITKFALYSLLDATLIPDRTSFNYYIAVSTGFVLDCSDYIDDFRSLVVTDVDLDKWIAKNLKNPTLALLKLDDVKTELLDIFSKIKVEKIYPQNLDTYLSEPGCISLISLFFEVRTVTDNNEIKVLGERIFKYYNHMLDEPKIKEELQRGSSSLKFEKNEIDEIPDSHIKRAETDELYNWICADVEKDKFNKEQNVCLLAGNAGMGKTVILKDLYVKLAAENIPVLGLKADKLYSANINELQNKIGLTIPVFDFVEQCKQKYKKVVLIIDQIDALSQSMSSDRNYLIVFKSLIDNYTHDANIRIIISVRIFDLHYDPSLRIYKHVKTVTVELLAEAAVLEQLQKINISKDDLSGKLLHLLRTPNHLNVFSRIAGQQNLGITTIEGLYAELWRQKIVNVPVSASITVRDVKELLYKIANQMFKNQRIAISEHLFEGNNKELSYLESERLIKKEGAQIQFFHQTFYDFVFAKRFVERKENLPKYIKKQEQSILIRSAVKMIVSYLREYDPEAYIMILGKLFNDQKVYFHIKHMLLSLLTYVDQPSEEEANLVVGVISKSLTLNTLFLEHAKSPQWLGQALNNKQLDFLLNKAGSLENFTDNDIDPQKASEYLQYRRHVGTGFLSRYILNDNEEAWDFLLKITDQSVIRHILYNLQEWNNPKAFKLLAICEDYESVDQFGYHHVLEQIAKKDPLFSFNKIRPSLLSEAYSDKSSDKDYEEQSLLKSLSKSIPEKLITTLLKIIKRNISNRNLFKTVIIDDYKFTRIDLQDSENLYGREYLYRLLAVCLRRAARKESKEFIDFLQRCKHSKYKTILRLVVFALKSNEQRYVDFIFDLFCYLDKSNHLKRGGDFSFEFRQLFQTAFPLFSDEQKKFALNTITNLVVKDEAYVYKGRETPYLSFTWGLSKYALLLRLPPSTIEEDRTLKREFQELQRKFKTFKDKSTLGSPMAGVVRRPLSQDAYQKMSKDHWIKSFQQYNGARGDFQEDFLKGGLEEHSWAFRDSVQKDPSLIKIKIIDAIIGEPSIPVVYPILGLLGLTEAEGDPVTIGKLLKRILNQGDYQAEFRHCISIARYLVGNDCDDSEIVKFLVNAALHKGEADKNMEISFEETSVGGLITKGINTLHGSAASALVYIKDSRYEDLVFNTLENICKEGPKESRAAVLFKFAFLMHLNRERAFRLFSNTLNTENNVFVLASGIWSLQYMGNYDFEKLRPAYEKLVSAPNIGRDDSQWLFTILFCSYLFEKPGADSLLYALLAKNIYSQTWAMHEITKHYYLNEDAPQKCNALLMYLLAKSPEHTDDKLKLSFLKIDDIKIEHAFEFLECYIKSANFNISQNFITYLTNQCNQFPFKCIALFNLALLQNSTANNNSYNMRDNDQITKFIVGAFNALKGNDAESRKQRTSLLESFDLVLKDFKFRHNTEKILEELI